jgi:NAD(P)-dependent dehydrogenase (short-subunit alcohol dehydrogenase family)
MFAERGHTVVLVARERRVLEVAEGLRSEGLAVTGVAGDLTSGTVPLPDAVDILVHAAADPPRFARSVDVTDAELDQAWQVTVPAAAALVRRVVPGMQARGWGRLLFVGSASATLGGPGQLAYTAAKAALVGMVRTLAVEHGRHGITANLVVPGLVDTERTRQAVPTAVRHRVVAATAAKRVGQPEEVAWVVAMLAEDGGGFVNGAVVPVDGGLGLGGGLA